MEENKFAELRSRAGRRYRPWPLKIICGGLVLLPFANLAFYAMTLGVSPLRLVEQLVPVYGGFGVSLLALAPFAGAALFTVTRAGYFAFLGFIFSVFANNIRLIVSRDVQNDFLYLALNGCIIVFCVYLLRSNRRYPFLARGKRGFRRNKRIAVE